MIETITYKNHIYPALQGEGNAMAYAIPFANKVLRHCQTTYDVGCNREEWKYPGAIAVDPVIDSRYDAMNFPPTNNSPDSIISSHFLEHYKGSWAAVLEYWHSQLCNNGIVFLYLPHKSQHYWKSWNNRKHVHNFCPTILRDYFNDCGLWKNVFVTEGYDLNHSFYAIAQKK